MGRYFVGVLVVLFVGQILAEESHGRGMGMMGGEGGMMGGMQHGGGMMMKGKMSEMMKSMKAIHYLLHHRHQIKREVHETNCGIKSRTKSHNPKV